MIRHFAPSCEQEIQDIKETAEHISSMKVRDLEEGKMFVQALRKGARQYLKLCGDPIEIDRLIIEQKRHAEHLEEARKNEIKQKTLYDELEALRNSFKPHPTPPYMTTRVNNGIFMGHTMNAGVHTRRIVPSDEYNGQVKDNSDGTYTVSYQCPRWKDVTAHKLKVSICDEFGNHAANSPYFVDACWDYKLEPSDFAAKVGNNFNRFAGVPIIFKLEQEPLDSLENMPSTSSWTRFEDKEEPCNLYAELLALPDLNRTYKALPRPLSPTINYDENLGEYMISTKVTQAGRY